MNVLWLTNIPSPYRVDFFNELGKYCELTVVSEKRHSDERNDAWDKYTIKNFNAVFLKGISVSTDSAICPGIITVLKEKKYHHIVVTNFSSPTGILAVLYMKTRNIPYLIESDGGKAKSGKGLKEKLKIRILKDAALYFSTGMTHDAYYLAYGAENARIRKYPFTSLHENDLFFSAASDGEKQRLRRKLNIQEKKVILSVGRFSYLGGYGKGYDILLKTAKQLGDAYGWYIVGGVPTEEFKRLTDEMGIKNFYYVDFLDKESLKDYYRAADIFVLMSIGEAWGLVVNEAMSCGLPVITTDKCVAGLELVENGVNGYIVPVGDDKELQNAIKKVFENNTDGHMNEASIERIKPYTIENMAKIHMRVFTENMQNG